MKTILIAVLFPLLGFAQEPAAPAPAAPVVQKPLSYQEIRAQKHVSITGVPLSLGYNNLNEYGVNVGIFVSPDSLINFELINGMDRNSSLYSATSSGKDVMVKSVSVMFKQYMRSTFYLKAGINAREVTYTNSDTGTGGTGSVLYSFKGTSVSSALALGNEWQKNKFTIGVDWVGIAVPITSSVQSDYLSASASRSSLESEKEYRLNNTFGFVTRVYLGASF